MIPTKKITINGNELKYKTFEFTVFFHIEKNLGNNPIEDARAQFAISLDIALGFPGYTLKIVKREVENRMFRNGWEGKANFTTNLNV